MSEGPEAPDATGVEVAVPAAGADAPPEPAPEPGDDGDILDDQADAAEDFLNGLLDVLDLDGDAEADIDGDTILVDIEGPSLALLIGKHGSTLDALQELVRAAVQHATAMPARLVLDIAGYRERQQEILERKARAAAARARKDRTSVSLEPMSAFERRVVHQALADFSGVSTSSEGDEPQRYVVIRPD